MSGKSPDALRRLFSLIGLQHGLHRLLTPVAILWLIYELLHTIHQVPKWLPAAMVIVVGIALALSLVSAWLAAFTRLRLHRRWQALGWAHYRQVLADMAAHSLVDGDLRFDYVTHRGADFEKQLEKTGIQELQYCAKATDRIDCVVFDIEFLNDLREGVDAPSGTLKLASLQSLDISTDCAIKPLLDHLELNGKSWALPLRWGTTGVVIKLDSRNAQQLRDMGLDISQLRQFDIGWLSPGHVFHQWAARKDNPCWLVALDWYLPTMLLLSQHQFPRNHHRLSRAKLDTVARELRHIEPLMHPKTPLFEDPVDLLNFVRTAENVIVLGGGNWLDQHAVGSQVILPANPGWLVWAECVGFLETDKPDGPEKDWICDAQRIVKWLQKRDDVIKRSAKFSAFAVDDRAAMESLRSAGGLVQLRQLPPRKGGEFASRQEWAAEWNVWKQHLASRRVP